MPNRTKIFLFILTLNLMLPIAICPFVQAAPQWNLVIEGPEPKYCYSVIETTDGNYVIVGFDYKNDGLCTLWLEKYSPSGNKLWHQVLGTVTESPYAVIQTQDGGFAIAGSITYYSAGYSDFKLIKTDASGNVEWNKTIGTEADEKAYSIVQTSDRGFAIAGSTWSPSTGLSTFWLVRVDSSGNELWNQIYEYSDFENAVHCIVTTKDGGFALAGYTFRSDGREDFRLVKTDSSGKMQWSQTYGGGDKDIAYSVVQTADGGFALAGFSGIYYARGDFWLVKTDSSGNAVWSKKYGGDFEEFGAYSLVALADGGFALAGGLGLAEPINAVRDFFLVRVDSSGTQLWNRTYGGTGDDYATAMTKTSDGAYVLVGITESSKILLLKTEKLENPVATPTPSASNQAGPAQAGGTQGSTNSDDSSPYPSPSVPEFQMLMILPFFVMMLSIAILIRYRRRSIKV
ncbi:MAG: hypothetical protein NWE95_02515 [Candidatus Bathyarchaeota archaeon]|nr:hypothetical protein [Candidatus Bathyarchaeota archaeon]